MEGSIGFTEKSQIYFPGNISYLSERLEKATAAQVASLKHKTAICEQCGFPPLTYHFSQHPRFNF
jgi:hypothetical protein